MTDPTTRLEEFLDSWHAFVATWARAGREERRQLVDAALADGLPRPAQRPTEPDPDDALACEIAVVRRSAAVDEEAYREANARDKKAQRDPVGHFCRDGWHQLRNPSRSFDVWWYWAEYLDPAADRVNPLVHYLLSGRRAGLEPLPVATSRTPTSYPAGHPVRRICLFAGYDVDGLVDDYVVDYLRELSRHADVYYLADCVMQPGELEKLAGVTRGAWAIPHGRYDFGSYSLLARDLVGWQVVESYDELLLANDSCYLVRPLDGVFAQMDATPCDWWGLQLTVRYFDGEGPSAEPLPLAEAKRRFQPAAAMEYNEFPHVGSYFLALRAPVIADGGFRKRLDTVAAQDEKINLIYKYETGTTQYLVGQGYDYATYVPDLYPYHPAYGPWAFELIGQGFPFLKRQLLSENPYETPDLATWKERLLAQAPDAPVEVFERNLLRTQADDKLRHSMAIRTRDDGTVERDERLTGPQFRVEDRWAPKFDHWWAFPVCAYDHTFAGNERAVFEEVRHDPSIKKIILTRSRRVEVTGENVVIVPLLSRAGQYYLARSRQVFVKHGPQINTRLPLSSITHNVINLWHGIPLKRFGSAMVSAATELDPVVVRNNRGCRAVVTSSRVDTLAMSTAFLPLSMADLWPTGLPRNDFITKPTELLPEDLRETEQRLRDEVGDRRLVMFLPTFKQGQEDSYYRFTPAEIDALGAWAEEHHAVLGVREHMADRAHTYSTMLAPLRPINLSSRRYPDLEVLYRVADGLVSDYSSCLLDFLLTGRPVISFAYDLDRYANEERGLFYDLEKVLPGPVCRTFDELLAGLHGVFAERTAEELEDYEWRRRLFFDHVDDQAAWRVVQRVKALYVGTDA